jgi:hypothetical protein
VSRFNTTNTSTGVGTTYATLTTTDGDLEVTFTAPASGEVYVLGEWAGHGSSGYARLYDTDAAAPVAGTTKIIAATTASGHVRPTWFVTGLTPGQSYTFAIQARTFSGTYIYYIGVEGETGTDVGPIQMDVWADAGGGGSGGGGGGGGGNAWGVYYKGAISGLTSASFVDYAPVEVEINKASATSMLACVFHATIYTNTAGTTIEFAVQADGVDYVAMFFYFNSTSRHEPLSGTVVIPGIPAGVQDIKLRVRRAGGSGNLNVDTNDSASLQVIEIG